MFAELKLALRSLRKAPGFTVVAVLTLGIGITVNSVFITIGNDLFFRPLPAAEPDRLVVVACKTPSIPYQIPFSYADVVDFRSLVEGGGTKGSEMAKVFSGLMAYKEQVVSLSQTGTSSERTWVHAVTDNYFSVLGIQPFLGRFFAPEEVAAAGTSEVLVLSYDTWQHRFNRDLGIVGQTVRINAIPFTIIGVAPEGFFGASWGTALSGFVPATMLTRLLPNGEYYALKRGNTCAFLMGRLRSGVDLAQAKSALEVAFGNIVQDNPGKYLPDTRVVPMRENHSRPSPYVAQHTPKIIMAFGVLGLLVLLVALANTTGLLYARGTSRTRVFAICSAIGATRIQLVKQVLVESVVLALLAGLVGSFASLWATPALTALMPPPANTPPAAATGIDWRPFVITAVLSLAGGLFAGLLPALKSSGVAPQPFLQPTSPGLDHRRHPVRSILVAAQIAISTIVLVCTGLALRSVVLLAQTDLGFQTDHLFLASFDLGPRNYEQEKGRQFQSNLLDQVRALPGVEVASLTDSAPLDTGISMLGGITAAGGSIPGSVEGLSVPTISVDHAYLATIGMPLVAGRDFDALDKADSPAVAIINPAFARVLLPGRDPIGQRVSIQGREAEVVGMVGRTQYYNVQDSSRPLLILPLAQRYQSEVTLVVRAVPGTALTQSITELVRKADPDLPLFNLRTMEQQVERSPSGMAPYRMGAVLAGFQGGIALLLASVGVFGLIAFNVARRTREIGIRMALGATRSDVIREVTRETAVLTLAGLVLGLIAAYSAAHMLSGLLYGAGTLDGFVFGSAAVLIILFVACACYIPIRHATCIDPVEALRAE